VTEARSTDRPMMSASARDGAVKRLPSAPSSDRLCLPASYQPGSVPSAVLSLLASSFTASPKACSNETSYRCAQKTVFWFRAGSSFR